MTSKVNSNIFRRKNVSLHSPIRHEGDGQELEENIQEDPEQLNKLQEIIDILVAAGYFRARIKALSPFDKVVGGMTWCIELCNIDLDVDLLFQENSTIGQKISLTEKIVAVLPSLKCPHTIEPHQIQGLDLVHIYPVIQWLVKRSLENRQEMSSFVRSYAVNQFNKQFEMERKHSNKSEILTSVLLVQEMYRPHRFYKRKTVPPPDIHSRVQITLLEYGYRAQSVDSNKTLENKGIDQQHIQHMSQNLILNDEELVHYEDFDTEEKEKVLDHYSSLHTELKDGSIKSPIKNQLQKLQEKTNILNEECNKLDLYKKVKHEELEKCSAALQIIRDKQKDADQAYIEITSYFGDNSENVSQVEELINLNQNLKAKEMKFREQGKTELGVLQQLIENTRTSIAKTPTEISPELMRDIEEEYEKCRILRLQLAKKNRNVYALQRKLDEIPSRTELAQYQKRFIELYNQVSAKHKETKQYYTLYNTIEDSRLYMQKELSLLNSICENYPEAMRTTLGKEEFITQLQNILDGVHQSKMKVEHKLIQEKQERDHLSLILQSLVEQQRKYVAAIRQLSVECQKHEALHGQKRDSP